MGCQQCLIITFTLEIMPLYFVSRGLSILSGYEETPYEELGWVGLCMKTA
jgi:hypothetical protein